MTAPIRVRDRAAFGRYAETVAPVLSDMAQLDEAEWSSIGRSPRFGPGWWMVPALIGGATIAGYLIWLAGKALANIPLAAMDAAMEAARLAGGM